MKVIDFTGVCEKYRIKFVRDGKVSWEEIWALEDIDFKVEEGTVLGVIGQNGAGKTTLLKLIAGMIIPDKGEVNVAGKVSTLMELGAGFNPEFTGRENIVINSRIYGLNEDVLEQKIDEIIEFADLGKFIDAPIKYYSQGMYMRLAFALAIFVEPDILLIDDILAVGDEEARRKCIKKIFELKQNGKTIVLVSHDMNIINSLCNRVILLRKGKIIKKGSSKEVTSYYVKSLFLKQQAEQLKLRPLRSISFGDLSLFADLESKAIRLYYKDKELTKGIGLHVSFLINKSWYDISSAEWQINKEGNIILIKFYWRFFDLIQSWKLSLKENYLFWQVETEASHLLDFKNVKFGVFLSPEYKTFFCGYQQADFPGEFTTWQDIPLDAPCSNLFGVKRQENFPAIILENQQNLFCVIQNSDRECLCRTLQLSLPKQNLSQRKISFSTKFSLVEEETLIDDYLKQEKQKFLLKQEEEQNRQRTWRTISSGDLSLFVDAENKVIRLYYKEKEITTGDGLYSEFSVLQRLVLSNEAQWHIQKNSEKELVLTLDYEFLSLSQIWTLICKEENNLDIKIEIETNKLSSSTSQNIILVLKDKYKEYRSAYEDGTLLVDCYINDISPVRLKDNRISKVSLIPNGGEEIPELFFSVSSHLNRRITTIYKLKKMNEKELCLKSSLIIPKKEKSVNSGRHTYFEGRIILDKKVKLEEEVLERVVELKEGEMRFVFDRGKGRILWRQKELTTGLSLYTSIRSWGLWYDSYQAVWQINQKDNRRIIVSGYWPYIPISQTWQIELKEKNAIHWKVDMEVYEVVNLEIEQTNIMLLSKYNTWLIPGMNEGEFLDEYTQDYDILPFRFWYGKTKEIIAIGHSLPKIIFANDTENKNLGAVVENSDNLYHARLLQYQKANNVKVLPGRYSYFKGMIKIESKK